jgi:hypothetical protein
MYQSGRRIQNSSVHFGGSNGRIMNQSKFLNFLQPRMAPVKLAKMLAGVTLAGLRLN